MAITPLIILSNIGNLKKLLSMIPTSRQVEVVSRRFPAVVRSYFGFGLNEYAVRAAKANKVCTVPKHTNLGFNKL